MAPAAVSRPHHPANWYTPNNIMRAPAPTMAGLIYFSGIGGSHVLPSNDLWYSQAHKWISQIEKRDPTRRPLARRVERIGASLPVALSQSGVTSGSLKRPRPKAAAGALRFR